MASLKDKVVIITGASEGIGAELARQLNAEGAKLALAARSEDKLKRVASQCQHAIAVPADITQAEACQNLITTTVEHFGGIDILVNNAGMSMLARFDEVEDLSIYEKLLKVNYLGAMYCTHAALPFLKHSHGLVVGISSLSGKTGVPLRTGYAASKHAMQGFFDSLRIELAGTGVDVCMISPGFVATNVRQNSYNAQGQLLGYNPLEKRRVMSVEGCARLIVRDIKHRRREHLMGTKGSLLMLGKLLMPRLVDYLAQRMANHR